ncbi:MAG: MBL fold metallo-hydrolase [Leptolyngbyaceae cyanobacterium bins.349]|nr:MBL fold metallo-hydrolase [Leptolyngbyaceae cyanobacterium bins.349]
MTTELILAPDNTASNFDTGSIFFVGNATVILRYAGFTILTDPNFLHQGDHVHLGYGLKSVRLTNPAIELEDLPPIDFVLLSHLHEDHFDRLVAAKLNKSTPIVSTHQATQALQKMGFQSLYPLDTWEKLTIRKGHATLLLTSVPARHGPPVINKALPCVMGSLLELQTDGTSRFRIYITGDTLIYDDIKEIPKRFPDIDLALLHLGGTQVFGIWLTMNAKHGVEMIRIIAPRKAIPIHYNDYHVFKSPLEEFVAAVQAAGLENQVDYINPGETYTFQVASLV